MYHRCVSSGKLHMCNTGADTESWWYICTDTGTKELMTHMCIINSFAKETYDDTLVYCVLMFMSGDADVQTQGAPNKHMYHHADV